MLMATSDVTITVTDVNEAPMVTGDASIDHAESNELMDVASLMATPADGTPPATLTQQTWCSRT